MVQRLVADDGDQVSQLPKGFGPFTRRLHDADAFSELEGTNCLELFFVQLYTVALFFFSLSTEFIGLLPDY